MKSQRVLREFELYMAKVYGAWVDTQLQAAAPKSLDAGNAVSGESFGLEDADKIRSVPHASQTENGFKLLRPSPPLPHVSWINNLSPGHGIAHILL